MKKPLIFLIFIALLIKVAVVFFLAANEFPVSPIQDPLEFRNLGLNILDGRFSSAQEEPFIPELYRTPLYPLFLSATYLLDTNGYLAIFLHQVMWVLIALMIFLLVTKLLPHAKNIALFIAMLLLLDPRVLFWSLETMSETLFTFLAILSAFLLLWKDASLKYVGFSAFFFGLALLTRPSGLLWLPGILLLIVLLDTQSVVRFPTQDIWRFIKSLFTKQKILKVGIFACVVLVAISPWLIRNYRLVGEPVLSSSPVLSYAYAFGGEGEKAEKLTKSCAATIVDAKGREGCHIYGFTADAFAPLKEFVSDIKKDVPFSLFLEKNITGAFRIWTATDFTDALLIGFKNLGLQSDTSLFGFLYQSYRIFLALVGIFGFLGIIFLVIKKRWDIAGMIVAILLFNTIITYNLAYGRHHIPLLPILFLSAGFGIHFVLAAYKKRTSTVADVRSVTPAEDRPEYGPVSENV